MYIWNPEKCKTKKMVDKLKQTPRNMGEGVLSAQNCWDEARIQNAVAYEYNESTRTCNGYVQAVPTGDLVDDVTNEWVFGEVSCGEVERSMKTQKLSKFMLRARMFGN